MFFCRFATFKTPFVYTENREDRSGQEKEGQEKEEIALARPALAVICRSATHRVAPFFRFSFLLFLFISRPIRSASFSGSGCPWRVEARTTSRARASVMRWPIETKIGRSRPGGGHAYPRTRPWNSIAIAPEGGWPLLVTRPTSGCFATPIVGRSSRTPT